MLFRSIRTNARGAHLRPAVIKVGVVVRKILERANGPDGLVIFLRTFAAKNRLQRCVPILTQVFPEKGYQIHSYVWLDEDVPFDQPWPSKPCRDRLRAQAPIRET